MDTQNTPKTLKIQCIIVTGQMSSIYHNVKANYYLKDTKENFLYYPFIPLI